MLLTVQVIMLKNRTIKGRKSHRCFATELIGIDDLILCTLEYIRKSCAWPNAMLFATSLSTRIARYVLHGHKESRLCYTRTRSDGLSPGLSESLRDLA